MKKLILAFIFLLSSLFVFSQTNKKLTYNAYLNIGGASNTVSKEITYAPFQFVIKDTTGKTHFLTSNQLFNTKTAKKDESSISPLFSIGARVAFDANKNWYITSGIGVSAFKMIRNISQSSSSSIIIVDTSNNRTVSQGGYIMPIGFTSNGTIGSGFKLGLNEFSSFSEIRYSFSFVTLDVPIGIKYQHKKFMFEQGVEVSVVLSTKNLSKNLYDIYERSGPAPQFTNNVKSYFNYYGGIGYSITKKVAIGATYKIGLTDALQASEFNSLKVNSFGLRVSYNIN